MSPGGPYRQKLAGGFLACGSVTLRLAKATFAAGGPRAVRRRGRAGRHAGAQVGNGELIIHPVGAGEATAPAQAGDVTSQCQDSGPYGYTDSGRTSTDD